MSNHHQPTSLVDLNTLARRESEHVEWKENVADIGDVVKTAVALANDFSNIGGGYIVCGAKEMKDEHGFQKLVRVGLTAERLKEVENKVLSTLREHVTPPITPLVEEIPIENDPSRRILVFVVVTSKSIHSWKSKPNENGVYYYRVGRETRVANNGVLREMLAQKGDVEPWDYQENRIGTIADIDLVIMRDTLQELGIWKEESVIDDFLSSTAPIFALLPPFFVREPLTDILRPRNFTLLLFSKMVTKFFYGGYTFLSVYHGTDRSEPYAMRHEIIGNVISQARRCIELLANETYTIFDKESKNPNQNKYPLRAVEEAVVNAIVHRDYTSVHPTRITVFSDRIEIASPGAMLRPVDRNSFLQGHAAPHWRNQSLAYFFNKLRLSQGEGQGIATILRTMHAAGCPAPQFDFGTESVTCTLPANPRYKLVQ
ncbi:MAG: ATP-binding protein [Thermoguttaceae bacterium]